MLAVELLGTLVFGITGGLTAVRMRLDIVGVVVLATATGVGGGALRDLLIGVTPPTATSHWYYIAAPVLGGLITFFWHPAIRRVESTVSIFDAFGLGLFTVSGAAKALDYGMDPVAAAAAGAMTAVGGGVIRDVLARQVPRVLMSGEMYAIPALAGAVVVVVGTELGLPGVLVMVVGGVTATGWRLLALWRGWRAPEPWYSNT